MVTGAAGGIGAALARRFAAEGARAVVVADRETDGIERVAGEIVSGSASDALAVACDVTKESQLQALVDADRGPLRADRPVLLERRRHLARRRRGVRRRTGSSASTST